MRKLHLYRAVLFLSLSCVLLLCLLEFQFRAVSSFTQTNANIHGNSFETQAMENKENSVMKRMSQLQEKSKGAVPVKPVQSKPDPLACLKYENGEVETIEDISAVNPRRGRSIFFHETSCRSRKAGKVVLQLRQACSVESAIRANPTFDIYVLVASPAVLKNNGDQGDKIMQALLKYRNLHIKHVYLEKYLNDTPVRDLYHSGKIETSPWAIIHLSDILRYVSLWKYGGIYLDLDTIVIKSMEDLVPNFSGLEISSVAATGIMGFDHQGKGHQWVQDCLKEISLSYRPDLWSHNSIGILNNYLKHKLCKVHKIQDMTPDLCEGYKLYSQQEFYPISYGELNKFFDPKLLEAAKKKLTHAWTVHLWNKLTEKTLVKLNANNSLIEYLAKQYCPYVYQQSDGTF